MNAAIIDASVAVKWTAQEEHADQALRLLEACKDMAAPSHWIAKAANALWAKSRKRELTADQATERVAVLAGAPAAPLAVDRLLRRAFKIAMHADITVYDTLYLTAAEQTQRPLVTADRRLFDAAASQGAETVWLPAFTSAAASPRSTGTESRKAQTPSNAVRPAFAEPSPAVPRSQY